MNARIILTIFASFVIAFSIGMFILYMNWEPEIKQIEYEDFYLQSFPSNEKKIYLYGSSFVGTLNETRIEEQLRSHDQSIRVYNHAVGGNVNEVMEKNLQMIILSKPDTVVIGVSPSTFKLYESSEEFQVPVNNIADAPEFFGGLFEPLRIMFLNNFQFSENPKFVTVKTISTIKNSLAGTTEKELQKEFAIKKPFFKFTKDLTVIRTDNELKSRQQSQPSLHDTKLFAADINHDVKILNDIIQQLKKNNINVILFTVPHHPYFHEMLPQSVQDNFEQVIKELENNNELEIYSLYNNYGNLNIWYDLTHIAINQKGIIYSDDVAQIISMEKGI